MNTLAPWCKKVYTCSSPTRRYETYGRIVRQRRDMIQHEMTRDTQVEPW